MQASLPSAGTPVTARDPRRWSLARFAAVTEIELKGFWHQKSILLGELLVGPVVYLALFAAGLGSAFGNGDPTGYVAFVLPGFLVLQGFNGFSRAVYRSTIDRRWGLLALKRLSGVGGVAYVLAQVVVPVVTFLARATVITGVAVVLGVRVSPVSYMVAVLVTCVFLAFWTSLAILLTSLIRSYAQRDTVMSLLVLPISFGAPVFYSLDEAPGYLRAIALVNPLSYQVLAVRDILDGANPGWWLVAAMAATAAIVVAAVHSVTRGEMLGQER